MSEDEYTGAEHLGVPGKLDLGRWLTTTARVIAENLPVLFTGAAVILLPHLAFTVAIQFLTLDKTMAAEAFRGASDFSGAFWLSAFGGTAVLAIVLWLCTAISQGAVIYIVVQWLNGRKANVSAALSVSWSRLGAILGTSLLVGLTTGLGMLLCIAPGVMLACSYFVSVPVTVMERLGASAAMKRSMALTASNRVTIFVGSLIYFALLWGLSLLAGVLAGIGPQPFAIWASAGVNWGVAILQTVVGTSGAAVAYVQLRGVRDGVSAEELASVFA